MAMCLDVRVKREGIEDGKEKAVVRTRVRGNRLGRSSLLFDWI